MHVLYVCTILAFWLATTLSSSILPPCNWVVNGGNVMRTTSCRVGYPLESFKFGRGGYDRLLCSTDDPAAPVKCPYLTGSSWWSRGVGVTGEKIIMSFAVSGTGGGNYITYSIPMLLFLNGSLAAKPSFAYNLNSFTLGTIDQPSLDPAGNLLWSISSSGSGSSSYSYLQVLAPTGNTNPAYNDWQISTGSGSKYRIFTPPSIINGQIVYADSQTYPSYFGTPRIANISGPATIHNSNITVPFSYSSEFVQVTVDGEPILLYISLSSSPCIAAFSLDLSKQLFVFARYPFTANGWSSTAIDESLGVIYVSALGLAGGIPDRLFAVDLRNGEVLWNVTQQSYGKLVLFPEVGILQLNYYSNFIRLFTHSGQLVYSKTQQKFGWYGGVIGLSNNLVAIPQSGASIDIMDVKTGNVVQKCPALPYSFGEIMAVETIDGYAVFLYTHLGPDWKGAQVPKLAAISCKIVTVN